MVLARMLLYEKSLKTYNISEEKNAKEVTNKGNKKTKKEKIKHQQNDIDLNNVMVSDVN